MSGLSALKRQLRVSLAAGEDTLSVLAVHATAAATPNATDLHMSSARVIVRSSPTLSLASLLPADDLQAGKL